MWDGGDAGEDVGEPGPQVKVVERGRLDQRHHGDSAVGTAIGTRKEPGLAAECKASERPLGNVVGKADPAIVEDG